jgi:dihydrofolate synthase/folylpolyglutamate synthase
MQNYEEVIAYLYDHLPYYQRSGQSAYKGSLDNTLVLDQLFNHPHHNFKSIHVAGTNGKGSVSHMLTSILMEAGYKTGLYTSPHLKDFSERVRVDGQPIDPDFVVQFVNDFLKLNSDNTLEPSFFELTVILAFDYFAKCQVDVALVEVGLGGRLDSTNVISPVLSVITNISLDHMGILGDTLGKIALEKGGIIKPNIPVVIGETHPQTEVIFKGLAKSQAAPIFFADQIFQIDPIGHVSFKTQDFQVRMSGKVVFKNLSLDLLGIYQRKNCSTVLSAVVQLRDQGFEISDQAIVAGLKNVVGNTGLKGRWQILSENPLTICDTGHNEGGIREVVNQLKLIPYHKLHFVIGVVDDKDIAGILSLLPNKAAYYFTKANIPRAMDENQLMKRAAYFQLTGDSFGTVESAIAEARKNAGVDDLIFIGGSTFVVAEALS